MKKINEVCKRLGTHTHTHIITHKHTHIHTHNNTQTHTHTHTHIITHKHTHTHTHVNLVDWLFTYDNHTFCSLFNVRRHAIGCINHDIVIGLCFELFMRLSYYNRPGYCKKFFCHAWGSNLDPPERKLSSLPLHQRANWLIC